MVDKENIREFLVTRFIVTNLEDPYIDDNGFVNIDCTELEFVGRGMNTHYKTLPIKFGKFKGNLKLRGGLTSLVGSPKIIEGEFDCRFNNLTNLEYGPEIVKGTGAAYFCNVNDITDLTFMPKEIGSQGSRSDMTLFSISYGKNLPLLRLVSVDYYAYVGSDPTGDLNELIQEVYELNLPKRKRIIEFQKRLIDNGKFSEANIKL